MRCHEGSIFPSGTQGIRPAGWYFPDRRGTLMAPLLEYIKESGKRMYENNMERTYRPLSRELVSVTENLTSFRF